MSWRFWIGLALAGIIALLCSGCDQTPRESLRFGISRAPLTLDPRFATDAASARINRLFYERLVDFDDSYRPVPALADWQLLTPTQYRFILRPDRASFHDGNTLTARDVKATYDAILDPATASPHSAIFDMLARVEVVDDNTVDFHLSKPDPLFPGRLVIGIMPARQLVAGYSFNTKALGSGTFELVAWPVEGVLQLRRRNDGQLLDFIEVKNPTVMALKLMRGEIDMTQNDMPPELVRYLEQQDTVRVIRGAGSNFTYLGFNMQDPVTRNLKLRQAIAHAINRPAIIKYVLGDAARPASALLPPDLWAGNPDLPLLAYDPDKSRQLVKAAGYTGGRRPRIMYKTSSDPFRIRLATVIQQQLNEVGIDVDLRSYDWGTFYGDIKAGRFQMFSLSWIGIKTPDIFHYAFYSTAIPPDGANRGRYADPITDQLIDQTEVNATTEAQVPGYRQIQARLLEQLPYVPLWYEDHVYIARRGLEGYRIARDGNFDGLKYVTRH
ncbi:MAG: ABC transporter substrate-binding protein [Gammaproteobacteria bacterium]|nr:ABC transporter substrate-binding protein [Gammaproteobacteria bacterium]